MADAAPSTTDAPPADQAPKDDASPAKDDEPLGDAGKKALDAERKEKRAAEKRATDLEARLKEFEDRDKSESEKVAERLAKAETEVASVPAKVADALRVHLVAVHKISDEDAELFLTASDPELLLKQVDRLVARDAAANEDKRKNGNHVPNEGGGESRKADPTPGIGRLRDAYATTSK